MHKTITIYLTREQKEQMQKEQKAINKRTKSKYAINASSIQMLGKNHKKHLSNNIITKETKGIRKNNKCISNAYIVLNSDNYKYSDISTMKYKQKQKAKSKKRKYYA